MREFFTPIVVGAAVSLLLHSLYRQAADRKPMRRKGATILTYPPMMNALGWFVGAFGVAVALLVLFTHRVGEELIAGLGVAGGSIALGSLQVILCRTTWVVSGRGVSRRSLFRVKTIRWRHVTHVEFSDLRKVFILKGDSGGLTVGVGVVGLASFLEMLERKAPSTSFRKAMTAYATFCRRAGVADVTR